MKRLVLLMVIFFGWVMEGKSQQKRLDSLLTANENHPKEDSAKLLLLIDLMKEYRKLKQTKERFQYAEAATALGEKIKVLSPLPPLYNSIALYYEGISDFEKSITNYERAIAISESLGDKLNVAGYSLNYGTVYHTLADYPRALTLYQKAANYYLSAGIGDEAANCYVNMGEVYREFPDQNEKAVAFFNKALLLFKKAGDEGRRGVAECYLSLGKTYMYASDAELRRLHINPINKYTISREYFAKVSDIAKATQDNSLHAEVRNNIGRMEESLMNFNASIREYQDALSFYQQSNSRKYAVEQMLNLGRIYRKQRAYPYSLFYLHKALEGGQEMKVLDLQSEALLNISGVYESLNHFDTAYVYYKQYVVMRDSIFNNEKQKEISRKQFQFEFGIKEREYQLHQKIADDKITQQEAFAVQQRQALSLQSKQLELTNREKEIQKLNYLKTQSELQADQKLKTSLLLQKDLELKLETQIKDEKITEQQLQIKFDRNLTIFMGILLIVLTAGGFIVYSAKQRTSKLNKMVSAQKEELEEMGKVKDKIFSIVSHDMRAPVNNLVAFSSLLDDGHIEQEKLILYIEQIKGTLDHTSSLMENLLNWAASQMQGFSPVIESVNISPVIQHTILGVEQALLKKKLILKNMVIEDVYVKGDRNMIELIIRNLVGNAIKFSDHGGVLELNAASVHDEVILSVSDNGVGMTDNKVQSINSASAKSLESTYGTDREKGTGLGLMLCKHFAGIMGGSITVTSKPGMGSQFNIALPAAA